MFLGNERHASAAGNVGYPRRAIRKLDFLYVHNYEPDRWPMGDPPDYKDVDSGKLLGEAGSKMFILKHRDDAAYREFFDINFAKRPAEELFDLKADPAEIKNLAGDEKYADTKHSLRQRLDDYLNQTGDPRSAGGTAPFDSYPYLGGGLFPAMK